MRSIIDFGRTAVSVGVLFALGGASAQAAQLVGHELLYAATLNLKTGNGAVFFYDAYGRSPLPLGALPVSSGYPDAVWTDGRGRVYVAVVNSASAPNGIIDVYSPRLRELLATYTAGLNGPSGAAFDSSGNMYVSNSGGLPGYGFDISNPFPGYVAMFPAGSNEPTEYLQGPLTTAVSVAVDRAGNAFVADNTGFAAWNVVEYDLRSVQGHIVPLDGLPQNPHITAVAFDPAGALVAAVNDEIKIFPHEGGKPSRTLRQGIVGADGLAYGPDGTLFAGNYEFQKNEGNVVAFPPGATAPVRSYVVPYNFGVTSVAVGRAAQ